MTKTLQETRTPAQTSALGLEAEADLTSLQIQAVTDILNHVIATTTALFVKTKSYHWHVSGPHFRDYHLLFDEQAQALFASIDVLAERVRSIGGTTIRSIGQVSHLQRIEDDDATDISASEMVQHVLLDTKILLQLLRQAHTISEECHDIATTSVLENLLDETEKRRWFLTEVATA
ncbi:Dps family protein [Ktedonobacter racemifer]|uniref:Ferritin Dps family protein n=1 Tax=Ktedonobacter racemifer DSM 44963 TaxID=485913 RepID=D6TWG3_KTERA|nr:DNA starvation/stationary phase protection protein [Ktedonobacter racemifer]EFH84546.1 Ferritin Dps family protein [Ktedonobacter racemifer DSM 44963]